MIYNIDIAIGIKVGGIEMENKIDSKTICCSCSHKYVTDGNDGEVAIACDCCDGKKISCANRLWYKL